MVKENNLADKLNTIANFLGEERVDKLKDYVTQQLMENLNESIRDEWIVLPTDFEMFWDEVFDELKESLRKKYKKVMTVAINEKLDEYINKIKETTIE